MDNTGMDTDRAMTGPDRAPGSDPGRVRASLRERGSASASPRTRLATILSTHPRLLATSALVLAPLAGAALATVVTTHQATAHADKPPAEESMATPGAQVAATSSPRYRSPFAPSEEHPASPLRQHTMSEVLRLTRLLRDVRLERDSAAPATRPAWDKALKTLTEGRASYASVSGALRQAEGTMSDETRTALTRAAEYAGVTVRRGHALLAVARRLSGLPSTGPLPDTEREHLAVTGLVNPLDPALPRVAGPSAETGGPASAVKTSAGWEAPRRRPLSPAVTVFPLPETLQAAEISPEEAAARDRTAITPSPDVIRRTGLVGAFTDRSATQVTGPLALPVGEEDPFRPGGPADWEPALTPLARPLMDPSVMVNPAFSGPPTPADPFGPTSTSWSTTSPALESQSEAAPHLPRGSHTPPPAQAPRVAESHTTAAAPAAVVPAQRASSPASGGHGASDAAVPREQTTTSVSSTPLPSRPRSLTPETKTTPEPTQETLPSSSASIPPSGGGTPSAAARHTALPTPASRPAPPPRPDQLARRVAPADAPPPRADISDPAPLSERGRASRPVPFDVQADPTHPDADLPLTRQFAEIAAQVAVERDRTFSILQRIGPVRADLQHRMADLSPGDKRHDSLQKVMGQIDEAESNLRTALSQYDALTRQLDWARDLLDKGKATGSQWSPRDASRQAIAASVQARQGVTGLKLAMAYFEEIMGLSASGVRMEQ